MIFLEGTGGGNYGLDSLLSFIILVLFGPPIILTIIGFVLLFREKKKAANVFFILAVLYIIIGLGICNSV